MDNSLGPSWLSAWQAICDQEAQAKIKYNTFLEDIYRTETKMKLMDLRVGAVLKLRDEYLAHLLQKYPNWKPNFASYGLRSSTRNTTDQPELFQMVETEIMRSLRRDDGFHQPEPFTSHQHSSTFPGPLQPAYYSAPMQQPNHAYSGSYAAANSSYFPTAPFASAPFHMDHHVFNVAPEQTAALQMAELKTEMSQIKSRLEDITVYLRELRHSAIELTTSVSRRSSMRDKERRGVLTIDEPVVLATKEQAPAGAKGSVKAATVEPAPTSVNRNDAGFAERVKEKLVQETTKQKRPVVHYDDDISDESDLTDRQTAKPKQQLQTETPAPKATKVVVVDDRKTRKEHEDVRSMGPRFDFGSSKKAAEPQMQKQPVSQPEIQAKTELSEDDATSIASDSPPPTATWLMTGGEKSKTTSTIKAEPQARQQAPVSTAKPVVTERPKSTSESSGESSPDPVPKLQPKSESGYLALLGAVSKTQSDIKQTKTPASSAMRNDPSDSDDLEEALAPATKASPRKASGSTRKSTDNKDVSLSDIFSFGKSDSNKNTHPERTKTAPVKQEASKNDGKSAEPADFLKKLFPDKFGPSGGSAGTGQGKDGSKKKAAFFMGDDDSEDDINLPQGNNKSDDLDDFFFK